QPKTLNLKQMLECFVRHRREVVTRRTVYELRKARERGHILEGQAVALSNIDPVIETIKTSSGPQEAKERLISTPWKPGNVLGFLEKAGDLNVCRPDGLATEFGMRDGSYFLSPEQAQAILELRLHRLTGLEIEKLEAEYQERLADIARLAAILADPILLMNVIREELVAVRTEYGDERRTEIIASKLDFSHEDLIKEENVVVTISHGGYAKTQPISDYRAQRRGGRGKSATAVKDEDYIEHLIVASTHDTIMCFTSRGKVYWMKVYELPQAGRASRGKPIVNILPLEENERITAILPLREYEAGKFIFMATGDGTVKKVEMEAFSRPRSTGLIAIELEGNDTLVGVAITDGSNDLMLFSNEGKAIRFNESDVRAMGRGAMGVRGMKLAENGVIVALIVVDPEKKVLTASANGYGKRTDVEEFSVQGRGGQGVIAMQTSERNGELIGAVQVADNDEIMLISDQGTLVRTSVAQISVVGRNTQGVTLIKLGEGEHLVGIERIDDLGEEEGLEGEEGDADVDGTEPDATAPDTDAPNEPTE
ncbi:MAG TPA: DNA gyrase C-terminal beta-propeller domain-containing protein, partial [Pseudomonadales bacterium]|nr:DNA gyrase C-terminal beta-propeller domain-containing protein [Pseudomonadales bacterium]